LGDVPLRLEHDHANAGQQPLESIPHASYTVGLSTERANDDSQFHRSPPVLSSELGKSLSSDAASREVIQRIEGETGTGVFTASTGMPGRLELLSDEGTRRGVVVVENVEIHLPCDSVISIGDRLRIAALVIIEDQLDGKPSRASAKLSWTSRPVKPVPSTVTPGSSVRLARATV
jgi:hypothetical protein